MWGASFTHQRAHLERYHNDRDLYTRCGLGDERRLHSDRFLLDPILANHDRLRTELLGRQDLKRRQPIR